jgi:hypothetical protein
MELSMNLNLTLPQGIRDLLLAHALRQIDTALRLAPYNAGGSYLWRAARLLTRLGVRRVQLTDEQRDQLQSLVIGLATDRLTRLVRRVDYFRGGLVAPKLPARFVAHLPALLGMGGLTLSDVLLPVCPGLQYQLHSQLPELFGPVPPEVFWARDRALALA